MLIVAWHVRWLARICKPALPGPYRADDTVAVQADFRQQERLVALFDEVVGKSHTQQLHGAAEFFKNPLDFGTGATDQGILFDADQQRMFRRQGGDQFAIDRFDKAHVGDRGVEFFGRCQRPRCFPSG